MIYYRLLPYTSIYAYSRMQGFKYIVTDSSGEIIQPEQLLKPDDLSSSHVHYARSEGTTIQTDVR